MSIENEKKDCSKDLFVGILPKTFNYLENYRFWAGKEGSDAQATHVYQVESMKRKTAK